MGPRAGASRGREIGLSAGSGRLPAGPGGLGPGFRSRRWPAVPPVCPPALEPAAPAVDDLERHVPGSFDDVVLAYDLGKLPDEEHEFLAEAVNISLPEPS
jgi:hypothetical protein